jgi:hypothetical protein
MDVCWYLYSMVHLESCYVCVCLIPSLVSLTQVETEMPDFAGNLCVCAACIAISIKSTDY